MLKFTSSSYWRVFRLIFVMFFLYLMGDAFYRWDGFRHYGSFSEFIPAIALVSILWTFIAALTAVFLLIITKSIECLSSFAGKKIQTEILLFFICFIVLLGKTVWVSKLIIPGGSTFLMNMTLLLFLLILATLFTWLCRNHFNKIHERITPLVFLFGFLVLVSLSIVTYHTWLKMPEKTVTQSLSRSISEGKHRPNIILVTFDALTALDMSAYGYYRDTTPFIKKWSEKATLFERTYTAATTTATTTVSLITGKNLWGHHRYNQVHGGSVEKGKVENIANELKKAGYYNYAIMTNENADVAGMEIKESFYYHVPWIELYMPTNVSEYIRKQLYDIFGEKIRLYEWLVMPDFAIYRMLSEIPVRESELEFPPETVIERLSKVMRYNLKEPYFMWIHFHPPHWPYTPPPAFKGIFDDSSIMIKKKDQGKFFIQYYANELDTETKNKSLKILKARYDEHIRYCDKIFESVMEFFKSENQLNNSVIMLSADHGESFRNGSIEHGGILYEQVTHIPLIIKEPGQNTGGIIEMPVHQTDIPVTILDIAGITRPVWVEGRSLIPLMHGGKLPETPIFSMRLSENLKGQKITKGRIATWEGNYKLIYDLEKDTSLLFDLKKDPGELDNIIDKDSERGKHLCNVIQVKLKEVNERIIDNR